MKKLCIKNSNDNHNGDFVERYLQQCSTKTQFVREVSDYLSDLKIEFYEYIGVLLKHAGFLKPHVTREGDVNCRFDATIIDSTYTIPIEIKSPREDREINIKAIRQAFENKVVLLSRKFYPSTPETSSLALAFKYPAQRSDVYELVDDIKNSFGYNIGLIDITDLVSIVYDVKRCGRKLNLDYFNTFQGKLEYEKATIKE